MSTRSRAIVSGLLLMLLALATLRMTRRQPLLSPLPPPVEYTWPVMGTFATVTIRGDHADPATFIHQQTLRILDDINSRMSVYRPDSEISRLNRTGGPVPISTPTRTLLHLAREYTQRTDGAFDPTLMPLIHLWGFSGAQPPATIPTDAMISVARQLTGIDKLQVDAATARFLAPGMTIDLGGIAKGFALDQCFDTIIPEYPVDMIFNIGGGIRCHGMAAKNRPWRIGVRHPFIHDRILGVLDIESGMAVATSGNYERFVNIKGQRFAHIISPLTGRPVEGMAGTTVLSPTGAESDTLSTALFVLGIENAGAVLERFPESHALLVPDRQPLEIYVSPGFRRGFSPEPEYAERIRPLP